MKDEQKLLRQIFDEDYQWKGCELDWCSSCEVASISCPAGCHGSSCNCGGCEVCIPLHQEFSQSKTHVRDYMTEEETKAYMKGLKLRKLILESLNLGETEINWQRLYETGELSQHDEEVFSEKLKDKHLWKTYGRYTNS